jgi:hypothetical protein
MKPGDLVQVVKRNISHGGKIAVVIDVRERKNTFGEDIFTGVVLDILMEDVIRTSVDADWFEVIDEAR